MTQNSPEDDPKPAGERIAKVLSRAGIASRREVERMIAEGRVRVNGARIDSPALNIGPTDRVTVDGVPVGAPEPPRLWLYHKPAGLVTTERDEKDRPTVFAALPEDMPRVMSVGRLDLNSEGLLVLTNDGEIKRRLELPATGWLRRYRVRINGSVSEAKLDELRAGITIEGLHYQPMTVTFDRQQGANAWLTVALREGKNREIRRAMEAIGVSVNRLIRISYGPFQLGNLAPGEVEELRSRVVRDQLGLETRPEPVRRARPGAAPGARAPVKGRTAAAGGPRQGAGAAVKRTGGAAGSRAAPGGAPGPAQGDRPTGPKGATRGLGKGPGAGTRSGAAPGPGRDEGAERRPAGGKGPGAGKGPGVGTGPGGGKASAGGTARTGGSASVRGNARATGKGPAGGTGRAGGKGLGDKGPTGGSGRAGGKGPAGGTGRGGGKGPAGGRSR